MQDVVADACIVYVSHAWNLGFIFDFFILTACASLNFADDILKVSQYVPDTNTILYFFHISSGFWRVGNASPAFYF